MTNLYTPRPFSTPYDSVEKRHAERRDGRRRHRHARSIFVNEDGMNTLLFIAAMVAFWAVILVPVVVFQ